MVKSEYRKSIAFKYFTAFIFFIVLPIFFINIVVYKAYLNTLLKNSSDRILQAMEQTSMGIENEVKRISLTASTVSNDGDIIDLATQWNRTNLPDLKFTISKQLDSKLSYLFNYTNDIESVIFFFRENGHYYYKNFPVTSEKELRSSKWYTNTLKMNHTAVVLGSLSSFTNTSENNYVFSVAISPEIATYRSDVELIYFSFKTNIFDGDYSGLKSSPIGEMLILDANGKVITAKNKALLGKSIEDYEYLKKAFACNNESFTSMVNGNKMFVSVYTVNKTNWRLVNIKDYKDLTHNMDIYLNYFIVLLLFIIVLFLSFSLFFFKGILLPIHALIKVMSKVEKGDFDTTVSIEGSGEIYHLGRAFNKMVFEIKNLIKERDLKERERNKAEIQALQAQINPHFLSNTLNSIRLMAMIAQVDSIKNMIEAFIKLLSLSFVKGGSFIPIALELETLESYIYIMKVRYGDKFDICFEVEEDIKSFYILKLILQPIVENAILHGISDIQEKGTIIVKGYRFENDIQFEIIDNGMGISEEEINKIISEASYNAKSFSSIGIHNVNKRIKLNHGNEYGIKIESVKGKFTNVKLLLPAILIEEEKWDV